MIYNKKTKFNKDFKVDIGYSKSQILHNNLKDVFKKNDYIIDFSSSDITKLILEVINIKSKTTYNMYYWLK